MEVPLKGESLRGYDAVSLCVKSPGVLKGNVAPSCAEPSSTKKYFTSDAP